jgi:lipopolysaccharide transport system ATP-binding protein
VRLAFAVAAHLRPDILLLDEVLAVGDLAFQRKCMAFARELQKQDATILFVSHNMFSIKTMCQRVIYMKNGRVDFDGPTEPGIERYEQGAALSVIPWSTDNPDQWPIIISGMDLLNEAGEDKAVYDFGERMRIRLRFKAREAIASPSFMVASVRSDGVGVSVWSTELDNFDLGTLDGEGAIEILTPPLKLVAESYMIHVLVRAAGTHRILCAQIGGTFHVRDEVLDAMAYGVFHEPAEWRHVAPAPRAGALGASSAEAAAE